MKKYIFFLGLMGFVLSSAPLAHATDLTNSLVSYWKLDEASGGAVDSIGSNNLINTGTVTYTAGKINNGANASTGQKLSIADNASLSITGNLTISAWLKRATGNLARITKYNSSGNEVSYYLGWETSDHLIFIVSVDGVEANMAYVLSNSAYTNSGYNLVDGVYDGSTLKIYFNGSLVASTLTGSVPTHIFDSTAEFDLNASNSTSYGTNSSYDEVGIWSRALSSTEVGYLYNSGSGCAESLFSTNCGLSGGGAGFTLSTTTQADVGGVVLLWYFVEGFALLIFMSILGVIIYQVMRFFANIFKRL